jgi:predicted alpha-1,2-mannosidase
MINYLHIFTLMRTSILFFVILVMTITHCHAQKRIDYVNPLIGTYKMGHTYPGATFPFGMVQLSPDTDTIPYDYQGKYNPDVYKYCAGYQYDDPTIVGFSHTHFSGTGHSDLGDFLIMPTTGALQMNPGTEANPTSGFRSAFSHANEIAKPNYYRVFLDEPKVVAEMTTSTRVGMHQYTFSGDDEAHIILDLMHGIYQHEKKNVWTFIRVENDTLVTGYRQTNGWARTRVVYFAMTFSKAFKSYGAKDFSENKVYKGFWRKFNQTDNFPELAGEKLRMHFDFDVAAKERLLIKFALSSVSTVGALKNLEAEIPGWDFEKVKQDGQEKWEEQLNKIQITTTAPGDLINFYTALYHTFLAPTTYMDVDGQYRGLDQNVHQAADFVNYTTFSLWDTYRALHPLLNIVQPDRNNDMIRSMMAHYDQSVHHMLPVWSHYNNENWCMIGYHSVSVVADAIIKGTYRGDASSALQACVNTANRKNYDGLKFYIERGYVPDDKNSYSVSKTLEYAYDDWCIAQIAKKLGDSNTYNTFINRSEYWRNVYDSRSGFMRPRLLDGSFRKDFDVLSTHGQGFIEGNAWNYSLYVPHDPKSMIDTMKGERNFVRHLDSLFTMNLPDKFFAETEDVTREGIIGNYVHGNEPAHHAAYLYNWTTEPWKTQSRVRMIMKNQYYPSADGLRGNDDCGQMSAWYVFSALGFYPVAPGSDEYALGSPLIKTATLTLSNGNKLDIVTTNQSDKNVYVKTVKLNGKKLDRIIKHNDVTKGGKLEFEMSSRPAK